MPGIELVNGNGAVTDLADAPPVGERGSLSGSRFMADSVWGTFDQWQGSTGSPSERELAAMLDRDGKAQALEAVLTLPLRWAPVEIEPHRDDSGEAEFVTRALTAAPWDGGMSTPFEQVVAHMCSAVVFRRAFFEKVWRVTDDGRWAYDKLAPRPAESCRLRRDARTGNFRGFTQRVPDRADPERFGPEKAFVYVHDWQRHPLTGRSALECAYRAFEAKQKVRWLWFAFLERHATPWAEAKDESGDPQAANALARKAAGLKGGGVIGVNKDQSLTFHEPSSDGAAFKDCMDWLSAEMSGSVLASFTDLAQQGSGRGSFALSADQSDFFLRSRYAALAEMGSALTTFVVADLVRWNFPDGRTPTVKFGRLSHEYLEAAQGLLSTLVSQAVPNPQVPRGALRLLFEKVAAGLDLDAERVREMFEAEGQVTPGSVSAGADAAVRLIEEAGLAPAVPGTT